MRQRDVQSGRPRRVAPTSFVRCFRAAGGTPVFGDIRPATFNLDIAAVSAE